MSITANELLVELGKLDGGEDEFDGWDELADALKGPFNRIEDPSARRGYRYEYGPAPEFTFGKIEVVKQFGGEGQGDSQYIVVKVTAPDGEEQFFRKDGYYSSYDGGEWDGDFREVKAVERTVVFYE
jgi:hypothetical protein